jgi:hypothetical protein
MTTCASPTRSSAQQRNRQCNDRGWDKTRRAGAGARAGLLAAGAALRAAPRGGPIPIAWDPSHVKHMMPAGVAGARGEQGMGP